MGTIWLHNLPDVLAGLPNLSFYQGWESRSRASGGYDKLMSIFVHHTASQTSAENDTRYQWVNARERPIGAIYLGRGGEIIVGAAGATNCQGVGGPRSTSKGTIPANRGNGNGIAIEAANAGTGEVWPDVQQDAYVALCQRLCNGYGFDPARDICSHWEWTTRKIDPAGNSRYATGGAKWDMNAFRNDVAGVIVTPPPTEPPPVEPPPTQPTKWWDSLMQQLPVLRKGSNGIAVKKMQHLLAAAGAMDPANVSNYDGAFGSGTESALKKFQGWAGGTQDGVCGPWTWGALMHTIDGIPTIKNGARGDDVERMQHLLAACGFMNEANTSNYDGVWGGGTENAKINFDRASGLTPSPPTDCGQKSWTALLT